GFLEFIPDTELSAQDYRHKLRILRSYCTQIIHSPSFEDALDIAVKAGRDISGFARVKIYQFQPDWSGEVVAESKRDTMESYKGLFFPATDIPKQARFLLEKVPYRCVPDVGDNTAAIVPELNRKTAKPYDLSWSLLRSTSTVHTEYLRNMKVQSTFTVSLLNKGKLWGILAFHNDKAKLLPFDIWGPLQDIGTTLMAKLEQQSGKQQVKMIHRLRKLESSVAATIKTNGNIEKSIAEFIPHLREFLRADGFVFQYGANLYTDGKVPSEQFILRLLDWATKNNHDDYSKSYITQALHKDWPEAKDTLKEACGVLIEPVGSHRFCHLVWLRAPITKTTTWAGDPRKSQHSSVDNDGSLTLLPRHSFNAWVEQHQDQSLAWTEDEIYAARELFKDMLDLVASQLQLSDSNNKLQTFSYAAAHDLKTPLRHIRYVLDAVTEIKTIQELDDARELITIASQSSNRLQSLIDGMMNYASLGKKELTRSLVDLNTVVDNAQSLLQKEIKDSGATLVLKNLPSLNVNKELITTLLVNLINNSIKYRSKARNLQIIIEAVESVGIVQLCISDNGQGINAQYANKIFEPLQRLHHHDDIAGNGLGLAICKRIVEAHNGKISLDTAYQQGARFVMRFKT
ncbi:MAG: ATP-binding protein, partial [Pseudomonadota bacterium]